MSNKPHQNILFKALSECSKQNGVELHLCSSGKAVEAAVGTLQNSMGCDLRKTLAAGRIPIMFNYKGSIKLLPIAPAATVAQCRFAILKEFDCSAASVNDFELVHEGVIFPPRSESTTLSGLCLANMRMQELPICMPLRILVVPHQDVVRLQRGFVGGERAALKQPSIQDAFGNCDRLEKSSDGKDICSVFKEWKIALRMKNDCGTDRSSLEHREVMKLIPEELRTMKLPLLEEAYFAFSLNDKLRVLSALTVSENPQGDVLKDRKPYGVTAAGKFYSFECHGEANFKQLGIIADDILQLRFCSPMSCKNVSSRHQGWKTVRKEDQKGSYSSICKDQSGTPWIDTDHSGGKRSMTSKDQFGYDDDCSGAKRRATGKDKCESMQIAKEEKPYKIEPFFDIVLPDEFQSVHVVEGCMEIEQLAIGIVEKLVFCGFSDNSLLCERFAKTLGLPKERFDDLLNEHLFLLKEYEAGSSTTIVGFGATRSEIKKAVTGVAQIAPAVGVAGALMIPGAVAVGTAPLVTGIAIATGLSSSLVTSSSSKKGVVTVQAPWGEEFEYQVRDCKFVVGVKLRLMLDTHESASAMRLLDADGASVQDELCFDPHCSYRFVVNAEGADPHFLPTDSQSHADVCRSYNFRSGIYTATLNGAAHAIFTNPWTRPKIIVREPLEYFCPESTVLSYWDPVHQIWGREEIPFEVDPKSKQIVVTLPHFSSFAIKSSLRSRNVVLDVDEALHTSYDYDFSRIQDSSQFLRGGLLYLRPCGWQRFAIRVLGKFDQGDDHWLKTDASAWPVAYHGTTPDAWFHILRDRQLRPGGRHGQIGSRTGRSIYLSKDPFYAARYAAISTTAPLLDEDGRRYRLKVMFQARVRPGSWAQQQAKLPYSNEREWLFENTEDIRLYGICVRQEYIS